MDLSNFGIYTDRSICSVCYPNHTQECFALAPHLVTEKGMWIGGYTIEKYKEFCKLSEAFNNSRLSACLVFDADYSVNICVKHLEQVLERLKNEDEAFSKQKGSTEGPC